MFFYYLKLAYKNIIANPVISALMLIAIAVGIGLSMTSLVLHHMRGADPIPSKSSSLFVVQLASHDEAVSMGTSDNLHNKLSYQDAKALLNANIASAQTASFKASAIVRPKDNHIYPFQASIRVTNKDFFDMFNVPFAYGSSWSEQSEASRLQQIVISHELNMDLFGGGNNIGQSIQLDQHDYQVVGILAPWQPVPNFYDVTQGAFTKSEQVYLPMTLVDDMEFTVLGNYFCWQQGGYDDYQDFLESECLWWHFWVELSTPEQIKAYQENLKAYISKQRKVGRFANDWKAYDLKSVMDWLDYMKVTGDKNGILVVLSFLFLAVCLINTLSLLISKFFKHAQDCGIRRALGASQLHIFYQHLVEVGLIGFIGGLFGLLIAYIGLVWLRSYNIEYELIARLDWAMITMAPALAIGTSILAGLFPAWLICRTPAARYLKS